MTAKRAIILPFHPRALKADDSASARPQEPNWNPSPPPLPRTKPIMRRRKRVFGCTTCKIRHLKCDETKPQCRRCTSTGRTCDGYPDLPPNNYAVGAIALSMPPSPFGETDLREVRALTHFRTASAPVLASFFDSHFWLDTVLRMSMANSGVRHAVVALTTILEKRKSATLLDPPSAINSRGAQEWRIDPFAITKYNQAITYLNGEWKLESAIDVFMLVCLLFVCIEAARGGIQTAIMHFNGGMMAAVEKIYSSPSPDQPESAKHMVEEILPLFYRVELLSVLFDNCPTWPYPVTLDEALPDEFHSSREARDSLAHLQNITIRYFRDVSQKRYQNRLSPNDFSRQNELRLAYEAWAGKHDIFVDKGPVTQKDLQAAQMLRMHRIIAGIWLERATEWEERGSDVLQPQFEAAIELAETVIQDLQIEEGNAPSNTGVFLLDMEVVSPVYYVAVKCRHPITRRRAIELLQAIHRSEGFFSSDLAASLAERIMSIEEIHLTDFSGGQLPAEKDRIHHTDIKTVFKANSRRYETTFFTKPYGAAAPSRSWVETITF